MAQKRFSERYGYATAPNTLADDELPGWVRDEVINIAKGIAVECANQGSPDFSDNLYRVLRPYIAKALNLQKLTRNPMGGPWQHYIPKMMEECEWWQFYDICQEIYDLIASQYNTKSFDFPLRGQFSGTQVKGRATEFMEQVNVVFAREGIAWKFDNGLIIRAQQPQVRQAIENARILLRDPKYRGPDEQFELALRHYNTRPIAITRDCVTNAVGAVEAVANILAKTRSEQLNKLMAQEPFSSQIHGALRKAILDIYGYRGNVAAHGQVGASAVAMEEAEWVLSVCAATMIYLVRKFGR